MQLTFLNIWNISPYKYKYIVLSALKIALQLACFIQIRQLQAPICVISPNFSRVGIKTTFVRVRTVSGECNKV